MSRNLWMRTTVSTLAIAGSLLAVSTHFPSQATTAKPCETHNSGNQSGTKSDATSKSDSVVQELASVI
ncbi:MAG: hypothetical protein VKL59_18605, partial [Nostocaceae cyanobacterium]|nr:hypothetical protein [Nostocaceae cyanobacterium]